MVIDGISYYFSKAEIEARMEAVAAEPIQRHYVYIAGRRFPPKQVIAAVTGLPRDRFGTQRAKEALEKAGFICARRDEDDRERMTLAFHQQTLHGEQEGSRADPTLPVEERLARAEALLDVLYREVRRLNLTVADLQRPRPNDPGATSSQ